MSVHGYQNHRPEIDPTAYLDPTAVVIGDVQIGADSSIWPMSVIRGDVNAIRIGKRTNIQDGSVLHVTHKHPANPQGNPLIIGDEPTGNLDRMSAAVVFNTFFEMQEQGHTIIVVTHDREVVRDVPNALTLQDGLIEASPVEAAARRRTREVQAQRISAL